MSGEGEDRSDEAPGARPDEQRRRQLTLAVISLVVLGVCAAAVAFVLMAKPVGVVRGRAIGPIDVVLLSDTQRGILVEGKIADGRYEVLLPAAAREPIVQLRSSGSKAFVESAVLAPGESVEVPVLALWSTPIRVRAEAGRVRADWSPIPEGEGYPARRRYSVLFRFTKVDGGVSEATLLSEVPHLEIPLAELKQLLVDRDPKTPQLTIELRAFDPGRQKGALWIGEVRPWDVPAD